MMRTQREAKKEWKREIAQLTHSVLKRALNPEIEDPCLLTNPCSAKRFLDTVPHRLLEAKLIYYSLALKREPTSEFLLLRDHDTLAIFRSLQEIPKSQESSKAI